MPDSVLFAKASSERIEFNKGNLVGTGAYSFACVFKLTTITADTGLVSLHSGGGVPRVSMDLDSSGNVTLNTDGSGTFDVGDPVTTGNGWVIVGISKGAGSVTPRVHIYRQPTWRHAAMGGAVANSGAGTGWQSRASILHRRTWMGTFSSSRHGIERSRMPSSTLSPRDMPHGSRRGRRRVFG